MSLSLVVCYDISRVSFNRMAPGYPHVYIESFFRFSQDNHIPQLRRFIWKIAPTTCKLIVSTVVGGIPKPRRKFYRFFTESKRLCFRSSFQLQHLQNGIPLDSTYVSPNNVSLAGATPGRSRPSTPVRP